MSKYALSVCGKMLGHSALHSIVHGLDHLPFKEFIIHLNILAHHHTHIQTHLPCSHPQMLDETP